ncbi:trypsin-like peptidase domain-containing protein [Hyalangium rubrum]|uniref:Trypsin-like peptidase domain-containing protein n=1 Tax=Hyalangium rubrum TaxID=3103134 RepID=A0ABU5GUE1_9BACT|nr:trypsin-like peptidase domain-containing protein [Hyalangium sp. s54d21]MDY7224798.1 trypsin-like peptidase domain-containing protein [Hyalangium sp. s54d21]
MRQPKFVLRSTAVAGLVAVLSVPALAQQPAPAQPPTTGNVQPATREAQALPSLAPLVDSVKSAVVNVDVTAKMGGQRGMGQGPLDRFFGGGRMDGREPVRQGAGSGFIIDPKGVVVTNNHVVEDAVSIMIRMDDGRSFPAEVVGRDPLTDVAVLKLKSKVANLPSVGLGDSDDTRVGDWVLAIGNPFGLASSVSLGILSAKARDIQAGPYDDFLQTDAAINPGNSGGPLFNMKGEVIGMNTAIVGGGTGIGFSVPSNLIRALLPQLEKEGVVTRGFLGIGIQDLKPEIAKALSLPVNEGAIVNDVRPGAPGAKAGLKLDDVIIALDGQKIGSGSALTRTVALKRPGSTSTLTIYRNGKKEDVKVTLGTRPDLEGIGKNTPREEEESSKARVGVSLSDMDSRIARQAGFKQDQGALITDVVPGSPAERAELSPGMLVVEANRKPVRNAEQLAEAIRATPAGGTLLLRVVMPGGSSRLLRALQMP